MNEKIPKGQEMLLTGQKIEDVTAVIMDKALQTRPRKEVYYRAFKECPGAGFTRTLGSRRVDLAKIYPRAQAGDGVITDFNIECWQSAAIYLNVTRNVSVWYGKKCIYDGIGGTVNFGEAPTDSGEEDWVHLPVDVEAGAANAVRILCIKESGKEFAFEFLISVKRYPRMWANDYLFAARAVLPVRERSGEEGAAISALLTKKEYSRPDLGNCELSYAWPPKLPDEESFDFNVLCAEGDVCYVYTEAVTAHRLRWQGTAEGVWINGRLGEPEAGGLEAQSFLKEGYLDVQAGDKLLFRCCKEGTKWELTLDTEYLALPFLTSERDVGDKAVFAGPFYGRQCHGPEYGWDFSKVFVNAEGEQVYWRFSDGSELRIYLDSVFFGQWFYALMVGFYGIRDAAVFLEDRARQRLFCENMSMLAKYFDYIEYDIKKHIMPGFMPRLYEMNVLDNIGTMGMNLIDAYLDSNDRALLPLIERIRYQAEETIPRMEDGTYYRVDTMWADDLYMSCPFLVRMGRLTGDCSWYQKAADQIRGFKKRLYMEEEQLFSHIYFPKEGRANHVPWGRGNGWVMWTLSELLMYGEGHLDLSDEKRLFYDMAHGIRSLQDESGLWHQVLNRADEGSYLETSCTGMFLLAFTRGVKYGWLEQDFLDSMARAWKGLLTHSIDREGNVYGVCMGSGCAMEAEYYFSIPTTVNDDHGTGVILAAGSEYCALLKELGGARNEQAESK